MRNEILAVCVGCAAGALEHRLGLRAYAEHVEGIGAVGTSLQLILLGLCELLSTLILLAVVHAGRGDGDEQVGVVVAVDEHLQTGTPAKHIIDESVLLYVVHRVAEISLAHRPTHGAQRAHHLFMRVVVVQAPVGAHHGRVVVEDYLTTAMIVVVRIEVVEQLRDLALVLDEERFEHAQLRPLHLTDDEPVDEVVSIEGYQQRHYESRQWENHTYNPSYSRTSIEDNHKGTAYLGFSKTENITSEGYFTYANEFKKHTISAAAGYSYFEYNQEGFNMQNYNFSVDGVKFWDIGQGTGLSDGKASMSSSKAPTEKLFSVFARANYAYNDTYMLSASIRHEGSSKFSSDKRWANFWSLSGGWRISSEKFMKDIKWIDDLKLRVGYGVTGNNNFSSTYMANMLGSDAYWLLPNGNWKMSYGKSQNVNPDLGWEQKKEWNFGIDYSLLGGRLYGKFDYFVRNIDNLLYEVTVPQPPFTQPTQWQNIGKMQIKGWEFEIGGVPVKTKDFVWTSNLNLSHNSGKIKTLWGNNSYYNGNGFPAPGTPGDAARIEEGSTIGKFFIWKWAGFDDNGNFLLYDKDNNVIPAEKKTELDKRYMGDYNPKVIASWNNTFTYKNWDLGINVRSWIDFDVFNTMNMYFGIQGRGNNNVLKDAYGKFNHIRGEKQICDYYLEDGTFLKIDAITLGYTFDMKKYTKFIKNIRLWGTCGNVCCITGYSGMNPEVNIAGWDQGTEKFWDGYYPMARTWTFGMQFNF